MEKKQQNNLTDCQAKFDPDAYVQLQVSRMKK